MKSLPELLQPLDLKITDLLLDPNNPRFAELGEKDSKVQENRYAEPKVQQSTQKKMQEAIFGVSELRDTIKILGFLPIDKIVVRRWRGLPEVSNKYVVIEGNRRVAALKWLLELHDTGKENFTDEQLKNFNNLNVLLLDDDDPSSINILVIPGLRHVSGIKEWGPYQKAITIYELRESGHSAQDAAQSLGLSVISANRLWRSYLALEQMKADEEFGEQTDSKKYSYFEEILKLPKLKNWLNWSDIERKFLNTEGLREFYSWIVGEPDDDLTPKLPRAQDIRDLGKIFDDHTAMNELRSHNGTIAKAVAKHDYEHTEDWKLILTKAASALGEIKVDTVQKFTEDDIATLDNLLNHINKVKDYYERLTGRVDAA
ncbi:MAG: ParB/Srx family N-terminal domain-containing protein [Nitrospirota bacterium]